MKWSVASVLFLASTATAQNYILPESELIAVREAVEENIPEEKMKPYFTALLISIRLAENGGKGREWGVMSVKANTLRRQAGWCAAICWKRYMEWKEEPKSKFLVYLATRYAPIGAKNDPLEYNRNWLSNVKSFMKKQGMEEPQ